MIKMTLLKQLFTSFKLYQYIALVGALMLLLMVVAVSPYTEALQSDSDNAAVTGANLDNPTTGTSTTKTVVSEQPLAQQDIEVIEVTNRELLVALRELNDKVNDKAFSLTDADLDRLKVLLKQSSQQNQPTDFESLTAVFPISGDIWLDLLAVVFILCLISLVYLFIFKFDDEGNELLALEIETLERWFENKKLGHAESLAKVVKQELFKKNDGFTEKTSNHSRTITTDLRYKPLSELLKNNSFQTIIELLLDDNIQKIEKMLRKELNTQSFKKLLAQNPSPTNTLPPSGAAPAQGGSVTDTPLSSAVNFQQILLHFLSEKITQPFEVISFIDELKTNLLSVNESLESLKTVVEPAQASQDESEEDSNSTVQVNHTGNDGLAKNHNQWRDTVIDNTSNDGNDLQNDDNEQQDNIFAQLEKLDIQPVEYHLPDDESKVVALFNMSLQLATTLPLIKDCLSELEQQITKVSRKIVQDSRDSKLSNDELGQQYKVLQSDYQNMVRKFGYLKPIVAQEGDDNTTPEKPDNNQPEDVNDNALQIQQEVDNGITVFKQHFENNLPVVVLGRALRFFAEQLITFDSQVDADKQFFSACGLAYLRQEFVTRNYKKLFGLEAHGEILIESVESLWDADWRLIFRAELLQKLLWPQQKHWGQLLASVTTYIRAFLKTYGITPHKLASHLFIPSTELPVGSNIENKVDASIREELIVSSVFWDFVAGKSEIDKLYLDIARWGYDTDKTICDLQPVNSQLVIGSYIDRPNQDEQNTNGVM